MHGRSYAAHLLSGCNCHWSATGEMACGKKKDAPSGSMMQKKHDLLFSSPSSDAGSTEDDGYHAYVLHQDPTPVTFEHAPDTLRYRRYMEGHGGDRHALWLNHVPFDKKQMKRVASQEGCGFCGDGGGKERKGGKDDNAVSEGFSPVVEYSDAAPF